VQTKENSKQSTGPKTNSGKQRVKFNAQKHGIFTRELVVSEDEKPDFEALRRSLHDQLHPASTLQKIGCERIVCCCWRCRLAARLEMRRLNAYLELGKDGESKNDSLVENVLTARWYSASNSDIRTAIRVLRNLREDVAANGLIHAEEWKGELTSKFGEEFFEVLTRWNPGNISTLQLAEHLKAHEARFGKPLPPLGPDPEKTKLVVDPKLNWQMIVKLIDLMRQCLEGLVKINAQGADGPDSQGATALDLAMRYATSATRELERAVKWYQDLKEQGL
jgi:hypothetical protein